MSKMVPVFYAMMVGWAGLTLDFHSFSVRNPGTPTADYLVGLSDRIGGPLAMVGGRVDLAQLLPPAPPGWTRRPYSSADGARITGVAFDPTAPLHDQTAAVLRDYAASALPAQTIAMTYEKSGHLVALRLAYDPQMAVSRIEHTASTGSDTPDLPPGAQAFGRIGGLAFALVRAVARDPDSGVDAQADFRLLMATMGQQASLTVLTDAGDTSLRRLFGAADAQALTLFLQDPKTSTAALAEADRARRIAAIDGS